MRVGFVGVGTMGAPIAAHLVGAGHDVCVFDVVSAAAAAIDGATATFSPGEAANGAACVFLSLPGPAEVDAALTGSDGVLSAADRPGVVVDLSTNAPDVVRLLHERCAAVGVGFVDAPVSGGRVKAVAGELSVMAGGEAADLDAARPFLDTFAGQIFHVGPPGAGTVAKLVNNQLFLAAAVLVQEAYLLGAAAGLDPATMHGIVRASSGGPYAAMAPLLLGRQFDDVLFRLDIAAKDLTLAVSTAEAHGVDVPASAAALEVYKAALEQGHGHEAFHATLLALEERAGIALPPLTRRPPP